MAVSLWDFFAKAFEDYYQPIKESREKDMLFGPNAKQPFQFDPAAMIGGANVIKTMAKDAPNWGNKFQKWLDTMQEMYRKDKSLFSAVDPKAPGVMKADLLFTPEAEKMYEETGTFVLPYTTQHPVSGRQSLVPVVDMGPFRLKEENNGLFEKALEHIRKGNVQPLYELGRSPGATAFYKTYPGFETSFGVRLKPDAIANKGLGSGRLLHNPHGRWKNMFEFDNADLLKPSNRGLFDQMINHETLHGSAATAGLPMGSTRTLFEGTKPVGLDTVHPWALYLGDQGEILARGRERLSDNFLKNVQANIAIDPQARWGTNVPIYMREKMKSNKFGEDYSVSGEHFGYDLPEWLAKLGLPPWQY